MTQFVIVIDASIVNVAQPSIGRHLHFSQTDLSWAISAYVLTFGGFLLLGGRLADLLGRRRMFMTGLILFSLASPLGGLAQSEGWLIAARALQGLAGAIVSPAALSIISTTFSEGAERNRAPPCLGSGSLAPEGPQACCSAGSDQRSQLALGPIRQRPDRAPLRPAGPADAHRKQVEGESRSFDFPGALTVTGARRCSSTRLSTPSTWAGHRPPRC
jgi:Major Facilitator Superfamily